MDKQGSRLFSFIVSLAGLSVSTLAGSLVLRGNFYIQLVFLAFGFLLFLLFLMITKKRRKGALSKTGLEWVFSVCIFFLVASWVFSPDKRQALDRVGWLMGYVLLFYIFNDAFQLGLERYGVLFAMLLVSGMLLGSAVLETFIAYHQYWQAIGSTFVIAPYFYRFTSLLGHPNAMMGLANLLAPLTIIGLIKSRSFNTRFPLILWFLLYLITIPFSSSRSGWIGFIIWITVLLLLNGLHFIQNHRLKSFFQANRGINLLISMIGISTLIAAGIFLWVQFSAHPSHGSNPFGGRESIWVNSLKVWQKNPWLGVGPDRFAYAYLEVDPAVPPKFWAQHAHSLPLQILAEFGIVGLAICTGLGAALILWLFHGLQETGKERKVWVKGGIAGILAWCSQMIIDDQTMVIGVMIPVIVIFCWIGSFRNQPFEGFSNLSRNILIPPAILFLFLSGWILYAYFPAYQSLPYFMDGNWLRSSMLNVKSADRDPNLPYYHYQTGLSYAYMWAETGNGTALENSINSFNQLIEVEPSISIFWANLSILEWHGGNQQRAVELMEEAIILSSKQPAYPLNMGWMMEQKGKDNQAKYYYRNTLELAPGWSTHPFWEQSSLRTEFIRDWGNTNADPVIGGTYWKLADQAINNQDLERAKDFLVMADWVGEYPPAVLNIKARLAAVEGKVSKKDDLVDQLLGVMNQPYLSYSGNFGRAYSLWLYHRNALPVEIVPGLLELDTDVGQYKLIMEEFQQDLERGDCSEAYRIWYELQKAVKGGVLGTYSSAPICIPSS